MSEIRPIKDLRNTNEISELCHERNEPVYITKTDMAISFITPKDLIPVPFIVQP